MHQQGLLRKNSFGRGKGAVLAAIRSIAYLQIDTISVVQRAHEHIMATRVANFEPRMLAALHQQRQVFEYWGHAASYLPFEHYRYSLPVMQGYAATRAERNTSDQRLTREILKRIATDGPLQSKDFEDPRKHKKNGWWEWKPAKQMLEHLFLTGELMITRRDGFQKVYDLPENVIPAGVNVSRPTESEWARFITLSMIQALGIATEQDIGYARSTIRRLAGVQLKQAINKAIKALLEVGELISTQLDDLTYYTTPDLLALLPLKLGKREIKLLSPFDNLIINRDRTLKLFGFNYQLECYLPAEKRKYGYFCLPLLWGDQIIGRVDAKADRKAAVLVIKNLHLEAQIKLTGPLVSALTDGIIQFSRINNCVDTRIERTQPRGLASKLTRALTD